LAKNWTPGVPHLFYYLWSLGILGRQSSADSRPSCGILGGSAALLLILEFSRVEQELSVIPYNLHFGAMGGFQYNLPQSGQVSSINTAHWILVHRFEQGFSVCLYLRHDWSYGWLFPFSAV
jgi:hypothetical protein